MKGITRIFLWIAIAAVSAVLHTSPVFAFGSNAWDWPKEIDVDGGRIVMYQPQPEELDGNLLKSRAAVSIKVDGSSEVLFGAVWFDTRLYTDRDERIAAIADVKINEIRFPDQQSVEAQRMKALLEREMPGWGLEIDLDRLAATLDLAEKREIAAQGINTNPPEIIFTSEPAVLVIIDGEPRLKNIKNTSLMRVVNTPFTLLFSLSEKRYYLYADKDTWYLSDNIYDNWRLTRQVPREVAVMAPKPGEGSQVEKMPEEWESIKTGLPPVIYVSTKPAELISSDGEPEYTPISRTSLLYISNTDSDVLLHISEQKYYVLLSGRWFRSASLDGPWDYVAGEDLPADFARIPEDSQIGTVLYAVPGTDVAREAVLDAYIPQTAAVDPNKASLAVEFDGKPEFEQIRGTDLYYAVNTAVPVIWTGKGYYACDQAVWFVGPSPKGPWAVATYVPDSIYQIPPDSPVYNVTFVRVYEATPRVVYVGYTPGYMHTYVYGPTIVYGTGYHWPGWYGDYYYPRPSTWGYHVRWNPWSGWAFGVSYSTGPFHFSIGSGSWYRGGWWGPSYYRSYRYGYYHRYRREKHVGYRAGYVPGQPHPGPSNLYRSRHNKLRLTGVVDKPVLRYRKKPGVSTEKNDVYVGPRGNVYRKTEQGWQTRTKDNWRQHDGRQSLEIKPATGGDQINRPKYKRVEPLETKPYRGPVHTKKMRKENVQPLQTKPAAGPVQTNRPTQEKRGWRSQPSEQQQLDRSHEARQQGESRARSYGGDYRSRGSAPPRDNWRGGRIGR